MSFQINVRPYNACVCGSGPPDGQQFLSPPILTVREKQIAGVGKNTCYVAEEPSGRFRLQCPIQLLLFTPYSYTPVCTIKVRSLLLHIRRKVLLCPTEVL